MRECVRVCVSVYLLICLCVTMCLCLCVFCASVWVQFSRCVYVCVCVCGCACMNNCNNLFTLYCCKKIGGMVNAERYRIICNENRRNLHCASESLWKSIVETAFVMKENDGFIFYFAVDSETLCIYIKVCLAFNVIVSGIEKFLSPPYHAH